MSAATYYMAFTILAALLVGALFQWLVRKWQKRAGEKQSSPPGTSAGDQPAQNSRVDANRRPSSKSPG